MVYSAPRAAARAEAMTDLLRTLISRALIPLLLFGSLAACAAPAVSEPPDPPAAELHAASPTPAPATPSPAPTLAPPTPAPTDPLATPTPDTRPAPEAWRQWPVVPTVSARARQVYLDGLARGNDPRAFSKVGDCQNVTAAFLGIYDQPGAYRFAAGEAHLQQTVDHFAGSFSRDSLAVRPGFNLASLMTPLWSDPAHCLPGEDPVNCELRVHRPSIVIISLETWFPGRAPDTYERLLGQVVDIALAYGALPILATKADNTEGDHSINLSTARVAHAYDLPLWNFWRAVQRLPDRGIDWARDPEGFHITTAAWNVRSYTALQSLDAVWRALGAPSP